MDMKRLLYFRAVVEAGALTRAAPLLQITPGTLSKAIHLLEAEVGQQLFARSGRTRELTDRGRTLYAASSRLALEYGRVRKSLHEKTEPSSEALRIASFEPFTT